jgi:hypothetical protein
VPSLTAFHLQPDQVSVLWQVFKDNVDPIVRLLHKPSMQKHIMDAKENLGVVTLPLEALLFAIYFASITSMTEEQCYGLLHETRDGLLKRYRFAVEQAFARASMLSSHNIVTLQALVIFLV